MSISVFDIFKIGIGPSSSHTVGPMKAACEFVNLLQKNGYLEQTTHVSAELYGSLALTGKGHGTDKAVIIGFTGEMPDTVDPDSANELMETIISKQRLPLLQKKAVPFSYEKDLIFHYKDTLPYHTNGMCFNAYQDDKVLLTKVYYSIGGGFIISEEEINAQNTDKNSVPYPFETATELLELCQKNNFSISQLMFQNELSWRSEEEIKKGVLRIADVMSACIRKGCATSGILPGGLNVRRRAAALEKKLLEKGPANAQHPEIMNWLNVFAMAVNEENAAGGKIVTAPTNGAAGIIPAVLEYYRRFCDGTEQGIIDFLLTAAAIAILYKLRASISGAEVGCQGEVGVACSMASGALAAVLGGNLAQVENAAEIGMEHNLGLPCDPPKGLVQIPCIERNAMGAVKAVNAARLALAEDGEHKVSLDTVINTMRQIGKDMMSIYKETSLGGLAVNVIEC